MQLQKLSLLLILALISLSIGAEAHKKKDPCAFKDSKKVVNGTVTYHFTCKIVGYDAKDTLPSEMFCDYKENRMVFVRQAAVNNKNE